MYRAVVTAIGPNANKSIHQLRKELVKQFLNSPACASVVLQRDAVLLDTSFEALNNPKLTVSDSLGDIAEDSLKNLMIVPYGLQTAIGFKPETLDALTAVGTIFKNNDYNMELLREVSRHHSKKRLSLFRCGHIVQEDDIDMDCVPVSHAEKLYEHFYTIGSQFLPARFRQISPKHLALAIRLNFETCEFSPCDSGIEELDFVDCMKIIGLEERI